MGASPHTRTDTLMNFWDFIVDVFWIYIFFAYLMILFSIFRDLFSDHKLHGVFKAIWILVLIFIPFLGALVYLISRHKGMTERAQAAQKAAQDAQANYVRSVTSSGSPTDDIAKAKALLDSGAINQAEFDKLKASALA
ncbi:MAG: hypothetical protein JWQ64_337 [Subtercola sp.]|nr:hypothetical protein [Subtercola sp.]